MISVVSLYDDVAFRINKEDNGYLSYDSFNNVLWLAQLSAIDWLSGDVGGATLPEPYNTQKNRDWLSDFLVKKGLQVIDGFIEKPADYYLFQNLYQLNGKRKPLCDEDEPFVIVPDKPIELLDNSKFNTRVGTFIKELKPKNKPIAKVMGKGFEFAPKDLGSVVLEYIRYPKKALIATKVDEQYNDEVPDTTASENLEWGEYARPMLTYFICNEFFDHTRESAGKQFNQLTKQAAK